MALEMVHGGGGGGWRWNVEMFTSGCWNELRHHVICDLRNARPKSVASKSHLRWSNLLHGLYSLNGCTSEYFIGSFTYDTLLIQIEHDWGSLEGVKQRREGCRRTTARSCIPQRKRKLRRGMLWSACGTRCVCERGWECWKVITLPTSPLLYVPPN